MNFFTDDVQKFLTHLENTQRVRTLKTPPENLTDLCSNDYLCLARDARLTGALKTGIEIFGAGSTASRLVSGHRDVFSELEATYAAWVGSEDGLFFANGYAANVGSLSAIMDGSYVAFADRLSHASLMDGIRLSGARKAYFHHNDLNHLEALLKKSPEQRRMIVTESLFSMDGDFAPMADLLQLAKKYSALLYVDDAHALGVYGNAGSGLSAGADFRMGTFGKALGLEGAIVATSALAKKYLLHTARTFVFSTAPLPAIAHAALAGIAVVKGMDRERLEIQAVSEQLRSGIAALGYSTGSSASHIIPLLCGSEAEALAAAEALLGAGYHVKAIRPPTVKQSRLRISVNAALDVAASERFLQVLGAIAGQT